VKKLLHVEGDSPFVRTQKAVAAMRSEGKLAIIKGNLQSYIALMTLHHVVPGPKIMGEAEAKEVIDAREKLQKRWWWLDADIDEIRSLLDSGADVNWNVRGGCLLLHRIANYGDYPDIAQLLLGHGADPAAGRWGDGTGETALETAAEFGRIKMVELFLERDAQEKVFHQKHFDRALHNAARENKPKTVEILLKHGRANVNFQDSWGRTSLASCLGGSNPEIVRLLLDNRADPNVPDHQGETALFAAVQYHVKEFIEILGHRQDVNVNLKTKGGWTPLHKAAKVGNLDALKLLLEEFGANPNIKENVRGFTPLHLAISEDCVAMLLQNGADPTISDNNGRTTLFHHVTNKLNGKKIMLPLLKDGRSIDIPDKHRSTPLHHAAEGKAEPEALMLLNYKADSDTLDDKGRSPLLLAASNGCLRLSRKLLQLGCNIEIQDPEGDTPLAAAAANGHEDVVKLLLEHKADPENANQYGETPLDRAEEKGYSGVVEMLRKMII
jgi:ankyrin repeat protein